MATPSGSMLMDFTNIGRKRASQVSDGLKFIVVAAAYGRGGYDVASPSQAVPLDPAATSLEEEIHRHLVPRENTIHHTIEPEVRRDVVYTTVMAGDGLEGAIGEAGVFAEVIDSGDTSVPVGEVFLLAHAHFPRIHVFYPDRLALKWPLEIPISKPFDETFDVGWDNVLPEIPDPTFPAPGFDETFDVDWDGV